MRGLGARRRETEDRISLVGLHWKIKSLSTELGAMLRRCWVWAVGRGMGRVGKNRRCRHLWGRGSGPAALNWYLRSRGHRRGGRKVGCQDLTVLWGVGG